VTPAPPIKQLYGQQCANKGSSINHPRRRKRNVRTITVAGFGGADFAFDHGEKLDCLGVPKQRFSSNFFPYWFFSTDALKTC